jgi:hypothetical protein
MRYFAAAWASIVTLVLPIVLFARDEPQQPLASDKASQLSRRIDASCGKDTMVDWSLWDGMLLVTCHTKSASYRTYTKVLAR